MDVAVTLTQAAVPVHTAAKSFTIACGRANLSRLGHGILKHRSISDAGEADAHRDARSKVGWVKGLVSISESGFRLLEAFTRSCDESRYA